MTKQQTAAISFHDVHYHVDGRPLLSNITGSFQEGRITTLVGPSGAGKTTLLKLCNGLLSPTAGAITVQQRPIETIPPTALRQTVGMALQAAPMIHGTVYDNLCLPKKLQGHTLTIDEAQQLLHDVHLPASLLFQQAKDLSGGQRQRVSIARTLVNRSPILLLDEITSALDRTACREIETLICTLHEQYRTTIVWITHNLEQAMTFGHHTWVMMNGHVLEAGPSSLLKTTANPVIQAFVKGQTL